MRRLHPFATGCLVAVALVFGWFAAIITQTNSDFRLKSSLQTSGSVLMNQIFQVVTNRTVPLANTPKVATVAPIPGNNPGVVFNPIQAQRAQQNVVVKYQPITTQKPAVRLADTTTNPETKALIKTKVYQRNQEQWNMETNICKTLPSFRKATLRLSIGNTPIYIHDPRIDMHVSGSLARSGSWESGMIAIILDLLRRNKNAQFLDLGANLGVYSLAAAKLGRKVIAVDPLKINIQRMCKSFEDGRISQNVTLVYNALSDEIRNVSLGKDKNNIGGTFVIENKNANKVKGSTVVGKYSDVIMTANLDHLMQLPGFDMKEVIVKMDVEGYEMKVLKSGKQFFDKINVKALMMEWNFHRTGVIGKQIIQYFIDRNYTAYSPSLAPMKLLPRHSQSWPVDIIWKKNVY